jgi:hypothetical protein
MTLWGVHHGRPGPYALQLMQKSLERPSSHAAVPGAWFRKSGSWRPHDQSGPGVPKARHRSADAAEQAAPAAGGPACITQEMCHSRGELCRPCAWRIMQARGLVPKDSKTHPAYPASSPNVGQRLWPLVRAQQQGNERCSAIAQVMCCTGAGRRAPASWHWLDRRCCHLRAEPALS